MHKALLKFFLSSAVFLTFETSLLAFRDDQGSDDSSFVKGRSQVIDTLEAEPQKEVSASQTSPTKEEANANEIGFRHLLTELKMEIAGYLPLEIIERANLASHREKIFDHPSIWKDMRTRIKGDYPADQGSRENAVRHYLRVRVNLELERQKITHLVQTYHLNEDRPFEAWRFNILSYLGSECSVDVYQEFKAQRDLKMIANWWFYLPSSMQQRFETDESFIESLQDAFIDNYPRDYVHRTIKKYSIFLNEEDRQISLQLNDKLVERGDDRAIIRKLEGLTSGTEGYPRDFQAARELTNKFIAQGNKAAIEYRLSHRSDKIWHEGNLTPTPKTKREVIEELIKKGNKSAVIEKIRGCSNGWYGYDENLEEARTLTEELITEKDISAINIKLQGLAGNYSGLFGRYPYRKDFKALEEFMEDLIKKEVEEAILKKAYWLYKGRCGYTKDVEAARRLYDKLANQGNSDAIMLKLQGYQDGRSGFPLNRQAAIDFNDELIQKDNKEAILRKIVGLSDSDQRTSIIYVNFSKCYSKNTQALRTFGEDLIRAKHPIFSNTIDVIVQTMNEELISVVKGWIEYGESLGQRWAYFMKAQGLKYGVFGFTKELDTARKYISEHYIPY